MVLVYWIVGLFYWIQIKGLNYGSQVNWIGLQYIKFQLQINAISRIYLAKTRQLPLKTHPCDTQSALTLARKRCSKSPNLIEYFKASEESEIQPLSIFKGGGIEES